MSRLIQLLTLSALAACAGSTKDTSGGTETETETDTDTDTDADADADADADTDTDTDTDTDVADDVLEIAIRRLNEGQDVAEFEGARDAFVAQLRTQPGVVADREFASFFDFGTFAAPTPPVFIGMTQYENADAFEAAGAALGASAEAGAFFATFTPEVFTVVVPAQAGARVELAGMAAGEGQVIEVVWRDLALYEDFDAAAYEASRDAALAVLGAVDGVDAEYQWVDPRGTLAIGMTVYASQARFFEIATDEALISDPDIAGFFGGYPSLGGYVSTVVR